MRVSWFFLVGGAVDSETHAPPPSRTIREPVTESGVTTGWPYQPDYYLQDSVNLVGRFW